MEFKPDYIIVSIGSRKTNHIIALKALGENGLVYREIAKCQSEAVARRIVKVLNRGGNYD